MEKALDRESGAQKIRDEEQGCPAQASYIRAQSSSLAQQLLQLCPEGRRNILPCQRESDIRCEETETGAAIIGDAVEAHAVEAPGLCKREHRIGQLDFAAGAFFALFENAENIGLEDVPAGDIKV